MAYFINFIDIDISEMPFYVFYKAHNIKCILKQKFPVSLMKSSPRSELMCFLLVLVEEHPGEESTEEFPVHWRQKQKRQSEPVIAVGTHLNAFELEMLLHHTPVYYISLAISVLFDSLNN